MRVRLSLRREGRSPQVISAVLSATSALIGWTGEAWTPTLRRMDWWAYVQRIAGSSAREISRRTGIGQTSVNRWQHSSPKPQSVAIFARTYQRPILEAFVAAGLISEEDIELTQVPRDYSEMSPEELVTEMGKIAAEMRSRIEGD